MDYSTLWIRSLNIKITAGPYIFIAKLQESLAPKTCAEFIKLLPYKQKLIQARWSGQSAWIPLGDFKLDVPVENQTNTPAPGEILFYPGGISETEILFPYGKTIFACKDGLLSGNSFLKIIKGNENLDSLGELVLWKGAQDIVFEKAED
jgi:Protein of unknown function (DUF3830)